MTVNNLTKTSDIIFCHRCYYLLKKTMRFFVSKILNLKAQVRHMKNTGPEKRVFSWEEGLSSLQDGG